MVLTAPQLLSVRFFNSLNPDEIRLRVCTFLGTSFGA
jgi:hypothetical protein